MSDSSLERFKTWAEPADRFVMARISYGREWVTRAAIVAFVYAVLAVVEPVAAVSLASGLAVGGIYRWGWRVGAGVLAGSLLATSRSLPLDATVLVATARTACACGGAALLARALGPSAAWPAPRQLRAFLACIGGPAIAVAATEVVAFGPRTASSALSTWIAATLGGLVCVPLLGLSIDRNTGSWPPERMTRTVAAAVMGVALVGAAWLPSSRDVWAAQAMLTVATLATLFVSGYACQQSQKVRTLESSVALLEGRASTATSEPQLLTHLPSFEWVLATDTFEWSSEFRRLFGVANAAPTTNLQAVRSRLHAQDRASFDAAIAQARTDGDAFALDVRVALPNRDTRWVRVRGHAEVIAGRVVRLQGTGEDVTDAKLSDQRLQASEVQATSIVDASSEGFVTTDRFDRILEWNRHAEATFGWKRSEVVGRPLVDLVIPATERAAYRETAALNVRRELTAVHRDGHEFPIELVAWTTSDADGDVLFHAFVHDISERLADKAAVAAALEEAREASRLKSAFLANTSHEIRTPMNGVTGMVELLKTSALDATQREWLTTMEASASSLRSIIDDILDVSKIEANQLEIENSDYALGDLVRDVVAPVAPAATSRGIAVSAVVKPSTPAMVHGDHQRVRQVLGNLVDNAVKFTDTGTVTVTVSMKAKRLRFEVTDTGAGIATEHVDRLFEPFVQLDGSNTRRHGGTGLGLAIARELVQRMGGEIGVDSAVGKGSTFWFTLPAVVVAAPEPVAETPPPPAPTTPEPVATPAPSGRVLVVEDNAVNRMVATQLLKSLGYTTEIAEDGLVAVKACEAAQYDAILMDCQMPNMDGFEATLAIRAMENGAAHTPIIAVTASAMMEDRERCTEVGMDDFVAKPIAKDVLAETLDRCLKHRATPRRRTRAKA